jgi:hypothetical protein
MHCECVLVRNKLPAINCGTTAPHVAPEGFVTTHDKRQGGNGRCRASLDVARSLLRQRAIVDLGSHAPLRIVELALLLTGVEVAEQLKSPGAAAAAQNKQGVVPWRWMPLDKVRASVVKEN